MKQLGTIKNATNKKEKQNSHYGYLHNHYIRRTEYDFILVNSLGSSSSQLNQKAALLTSESRSRVSEASACGPEARRGGVGRAEQATRRCSVGRSEQSLQEAAR